MTQKENREQSDKERILIDCIKEGLDSSEAYSAEFHTLMMEKAAKIGIEDFNHNKYWKLVDKAIVEYARKEEEIMLKELSLLIIDARASWDRDKMDLIKEMEDDMEKLTAAEAKNIALSKSDEVKKMVDDCLLYIKSQAEEGKFSCTLTAIYNESNVEATKQLRELGYDVAYVCNNTSMSIIISW